MTNYTVHQNPDPKPKPAQWQLTERLTGDEIYIKTYTSDLHSAQLPRPAALLAAAQTRHAMAQHPAGACLSAVR